MDVPIDIAADVFMGTAVGRTAVAVKSGLSNPVVPLFAKPPILESTTKVEGATTGFEVDIEVESESEDEPGRGCFSTPQVPKKSSLRESAFEVGESGVSSRASRPGCLSF